MNFQTAEYFKAIAKERSFTKAAERLHVTQQTLSAHIAGVERELGCTLIERSVPLRLTHQGDTFLAYCERLSAEMRSLRRQLAGDSTEQTGTLRIGVSFTRGRAVLPRIAPALGKKYPNVAIRILENDNDGIMLALAEGKIDVAIGIAGHPVPGIEATPLYREQTALLASEGLLQNVGIDKHAIAETLSEGDLSPLATCPFVVSPPEDVTGIIASELFGRSGFKPIVRASSRNMDTLLALAMNGIGACICPLNLLDVITSRLQRRELLIYDLGPSASYLISLCLPASPQRWHVIDEFAKIAYDCL